MTNMWVCPTAGCVQAVPMAHDVDRPPICGNCHAVKRPAPAKGRRRKSDG